MNSAEADIAQGRCVAELALGLSEQITAIEILRVLNAAYAAGKSDGWQRGFKAGVDQAAMAMDAIIPHGV